MMRMTVLLSFVKCRIPIGPDHSRALFYHSAIFILALQIISLTIILYFMVSISHLEPMAMKEHLVAIPPNIARLGALRS